MQHCEFRGLTLRQLGEEGIRLCFNSTHNSIEGCAIHDAGLWIAGWGEGIYIGTSQGKVGAWGGLCMLLPCATSLAGLRGAVLLGPAAPFISNWLSWVCCVQASG